MRIYALSLDRFRRLRWLLVGMPQPSAQERHERLGRFTALAVLSSDSLSSVAYGTEQIMRVLIVTSAGVASLTMPASLVIVVMLALIIVSYRQAIEAYPQGGGTYVVARDTFRPPIAAVAAALQLLGNVLTVVVSAAAGAAALSSLVPALLPYRTVVSIAAVAFLGWVNLRGIRTAGSVVSLPIYFFVGAVFLLIGVGLARWAKGALVYAPPPSALAPGAESVGFLLLLGAVAQGSSTITGTEVIFSEISHLRPQAARQARATLLWLGLLVGSMLLGLSFLAVHIGVRPAHDETVLSQIGKTVFEGGPLWVLVQVATIFILILAASTAFLDFPGLASMLARDRFLPSALRLRGDRLVFTAGVIGLGALSTFVLAVFRGNLERLIPPYTVGVFVNITLCQAGLVLFWCRRRGSRWLQSALVNLAGAAMTGVVTATLIVRELPDSAWPVLLLVPVLVWLMYAIRRHLTAVVRARQPGPLPPSKVVRVLVPVADFGAQAREALVYARSIAPDPKHLIAVHVELEPDTLRRLEHSWDRAVPLVVLTSPYREFFRPLVQYIEHLQNAYPEETITVVISEFVTSRWWEALLHNRTARRLEKALLSLPGVVIAYVPYRLSRTHDDERGGTPPGRIM